MQRDDPKVAVSASDSNNSKVSVFVLDYDGCLHTVRFDSLLDHMGSIFSEASQPIFALNAEEGREMNEQEKNELKTTLLAAIEKFEFPANGKFIVHRQKKDDPKDPGRDHAKDFMKLFNEVSPEILINIFKKANALLVQYMAEKVKEQNADHISLILGSNRQALGNDLAGISLNGSGSPYFDLYIIKDELERLTKLPCTLNPFTTTDIYSNASPGDNYRKILALYGVRSPSSPTEEDLAQARASNNYLVNAFHLKYAVAVYEAYHAGKTDDLADPKKSRDFYLEVYRRAKDLAALEIIPDAWFGIESKTRSAGEPSILDDWNQFIQPYRDSHQQSLRIAGHLDQFPTSVFDTNKVIMLSALISATDNLVPLQLGKPQGQVNFHINFLDDHPKYLSMCHEIFEKNPQLLPEGMLLSMTQCDKGKKVREFPTLIGTGSHDEDYYETVKEMASMALKIKSYQLPEYIHTGIDDYVAKDFTDFIQKREESRIANQALADELTKIEEENQLKEQNQLAFSHHSFLSSLGTPEAEPQEAKGVKPNPSPSPARGKTSKE